MKRNSHFATYRLVFSALMLALATALSVVKAIQLPYGGSVTVLSMVPLIVMAQIYKTRWSLFACTVYGVLQLMLGVANLRGVNLMTLVGAVLFDYIIAFAVIGFAGLTAGMKNKAVGAALGAVIGLSLRFVCHFLSGWLFWSESIGTWEAVIGSLTYNASYMLPELVLTSVASAIIWPLISRLAPVQGLENDDH